MTKSLPTGLFLPKTAKAEVKVWPCVAMETVSDDGHTTSITSVPPVECKKTRLTGFTIYTL